jgi:hypothetical protein
MIRIDIINIITLKKQKLMIRAITAEIKKLNKNAIELILQL